MPDRSAAIARISAYRSIITHYIVHPHKLLRTDDLKFASTSKIHLKRRRKQNVIIFTLFLPRRFFQRRFWQRFVVVIVFFFFILLVWHERSPNWQYFVVRNACGWVCVCWCVNCFRLALIRIRKLCAASQNSCLLAREHTLFVFTLFFLLLKFYSCHLPVNCYSFRLLRAMMCNVHNTHISRA